MKTLVFFLGMMITSTFAFANTVVYQIGNPDSILSSYTGPYVELTVDVTSAGTATLTFQSLSNDLSGYTYLIGGNNSVNFNLSSGTAGTPTLTPAFSSATYMTNSTTSLVDFGSFNNSIRLFGGYKNTVSQMVINITGGSWGINGASSVLTTNSSGYLAAARIYVCNNYFGEGCNDYDNALAMGFAAKPGVLVPEPATMLLLGTSTLGLGFLKRKK